MWCDINRELAENYFYEIPAVNHNSSETHPNT